MQELDFDHTMYEREYAGDDRMLVYFFTEVIPDEEASKVAGIRKFREAEMIHIAAPGAKSSIIIREVREDDKHRFAAKYEKFQKGMVDEQVEGYPLKEWSILSRSMVEELKHLGFRTVEQIASASDSVVSKYPGLRELQSRAKTWLESQKSTVPLEKLHTQVEEMKKQMDALLKANEDLVAAAKAKKAA
jgi:hypothetical protein